MPTINKQKLISSLLTSLPKHLDAAGNGDTKALSLPVLEQVIFALLREGTTRDLADKAYRSLCETFYDWNEIRVSSIREIADTIEGLPAPDARAQRIITFLQEVFETTFSFDLEGLHKKGLKQAAKALGRYEPSTDFTVAWVVQHSLGGHAIPLDEPSLRSLRRMGLIDVEAGDLEAIRASLEHQVPKAKGSLFVDVLAQLADSYCWEADPACTTCPLAAQCLTAQENKSPLTSGAGRAKGR